MGFSTKAIPIPARKQPQLTLHENNRSWHCTKTNPERNPPSSKAVTFVCNRLSVQPEPWIFLQQMVKAGLCHDDNSHVSSDMILAAPFSLSFLNQAPLPWQQIYWITETLEINRGLLSIRPFVSNVNIYSIEFSTCNILPVWLKRIKRRLQNWMADAEFVVSI